MNDDHVRDTILALKRRGGLSRLLRLLGFSTDGRRRRPPRSLSTPVAAMRTASRGTLRAHVIVLRSEFALAALRDLNDTISLDDPFSHHILIVAEPKRRRVVIGCCAPGASLRHVVLEPDLIRHSDVDVVRELVLAPKESGTAAILRIHHALDRRRLTDRFFRDIRGVRDAISSGWTGIPVESAADRDVLALLLLSRLMFLYFLQRRGLLNGDRQYLPRLLRRWRHRAGGRGTFYRHVLRTMFFGVLNRRIERRTARARSLGEMPYLNGGLFERHRLELEYAQLDLPDPVVIVMFDALLEKYRFTTADAGAPDGDDIGAGIDPEMLGRIFEGLMPGDKRSRTGTFYTPSGAADRLVIDTLTTHLAATTGVNADAVRDVLLGRESDGTDGELATLAHAAGTLSVLDPACGSGAFLLGALARLVNVRAHGGATNRLELARDTVARCLHGVDLLEDAALLCSLRLWLTLVPQCDRIEDVPPLPNLDRRIRQGDALIDPLDVGELFTGRPLGTLVPPAMRPIVMRLVPASREYIASGPETRPALRRTLASLETRLARAWLSTIERELDHGIRELNARSHDVDLFGSPTSTAVAARTRLPSIQARRAELAAFLDDTRGRHALPFFSFRVHFAEIEGFDIVLSNPPWVRAHNWPITVRQLLRDRYRVCMTAGWPRGNGNGVVGAGAQVDLAFLFLERAVRLLRDGGTLGMVLPAKLIRSLAPGGARALLLADTQLISIEDHSLDHRAVFDADAFTAVIVARRRATPVAPGHNVHVRMTRGDVPPLEFDVSVDDLPLEPGDTRAPWLLAPPECAAAFRAMQTAGIRICDAGLSVRRGAMTGANDVMIVHDVEPKLGDLALIRAEGWHARNAGDHHRREYAAHVEASVLRPVLRGTDVQPWRTRVERHVLYSPLNDDQRADTPPRLSRYLRRHSERLRQPVDRIGTLQRLSDGMFGHKVVWSDLASDLRAAAVPAFARTITGLSLPVIPLNTAYFIPVCDDDVALLLAAYLNSKPLRTFARAIAERAKDAHFRFLAWTIAMLPLPRDWRGGALAVRLTAMSRDAHAAGGIAPQDRSELDAIVAHAFGLTTSQIDAIDELDAWFRGGLDVQPDR